jgi:Zn finger protein HypA/HybF involved in hydrogenase expression
MDSENALAEAPEKGTRMRCTKCGRKWTYKGCKKYYACCPDCHTSVRIRTGREVKL